MPAAAAPLDDIDDAACQRAMAVLLRVGTALAEQLETPSDTIPITARATAFEAIARAVRFTILLARHVAQHRDTAETRRTEARKGVIRAVEDAIQRSARPSDIEPLRRELLERIDATDFDVALLDRLRGQLIVEICNDLGLANVPGLSPKLRRTPDDIAILCAQAAAPAGSGLPQWLAAAANDPAAPPPDTRDRTTLCEFTLKER